jgi:hypothetical protein
VAASHPAPPRHKITISGWSTSWTRWFQASNRDILIARDRAGTIVATLLFDGPGADTVFLPMLGPAAALT